MKSVLSVLRMFGLGVVVAGWGWSGLAQASPRGGDQAAPGGGTQTAPAAGDQAGPPHGQVLFDKDESSAAAAKKADEPVVQPAVAVTDAERGALMFTAYDLDVHLVPAKSQISVLAKFTVRNAGSVPLTRVVLQISSTLRWESFAVRRGSGIVALGFAQAVIDTDADHTGKAQEAVVTLPSPLAAGASVALTGVYSGTIERSGERLERIGAPVEQAAQADWDAIAAERTALRGFGNVLWYPTAAMPVFLGDGAKLFEAVGETKLRQAEATVRLRLSAEYVGDPPDAAYFCGRPEKLVGVSENNNVAVAESPGVATAEFVERPLGFRVLSLFVTDRAPTTTDGDVMAVVTDHYDALPNYAAAAAKVEPLLKDWLGADPLRTLEILDQDGQPFEDDALLVTRVRAGSAAVLEPMVLHSLTHAWFGSAHVWLDEGVPQFMALLWVEQTQGREEALKQLQQQVNTLSLAEPSGAQASDAAGVGQSLIEARDEVYYRTKAAAVLWMLRGIVGDDALKQGLQAYRRVGASDVDPKQFQRVVEHAAKRDLGWFFEDWVYRDKGLADLSIASVTPRALPTKGDKGESWLIAVEVRNDGDAAAEVPVTVRSGTLSATERLRIMGRSSASTRMVFEGVPDEVVVNDGSVPEVTSAMHTKQVTVH